MKIIWIQCIYFFVNCGLFTFAAATSGLDIVTDDDLVDRIKSDEFLITLFSKKKCDECDQLEKHLFGLRGEFEENFNAKVVKVLDSQLVRLYNPTKEPALVFFRHGVPLLYVGSNNADEIYQRFDENRVPAVKELNDENFEHLTQAATGATTGDWFVLFYNRECIDCQRLSATWEAVGSVTRNRINVARVDKDGNGMKTAKRFNVLKAPEFIFIRQGKFYRYEIGKYDVRSFVSFAQEWYRNAKEEKIKVPATPFDDLVTTIVAFLKSLNIHETLTDTKFVMPLIGGVLCGGLLFVALYKIFSSFRKSTEEQKKDKSKKAK